MRIRPNDPAFLPDLLAFLRESGCIAYVSGAGEVEAITPHLFGGDEQAELGALLARWTDERPDAEAVLLPGG